MPFFPSPHTLPRASLSAYLADSDDGSQTIPMPACISTGVQAMSASCRTSASINKREMRSPTLIPFSTHQSRGPNSMPKESHSRHGLNSAAPRLTGDITSSLVEALFGPPSSKAESFCRNSAHPTTFQQEPRGQSSATHLQGNTVCGSSLTTQPLVTYAIHFTLEHISSTTARDIEGQDATSWSS